MQIVWEKMLFMVDSNENAIKKFFLYRIRINKVNCNMKLAKILFIFLVIVSCQETQIWKMKLVKLLKFNQKIQSR